MSEQVTTQTEPKLLAKGTGIDAPGAKASLLAVALASGLWDSLSIDDRRRWCTSGEIADTEGGRKLFACLKRCGVL